MAAPTFQAAATFQSGGAVQLTVAWPTHAVDDVAFLFVYSNADAGLLTASGFVQVADSPQAGTGGAMSVWWCRATSTSMASPVTNTGTNNIEATMITVRGAITTGDPWEVTSGAGTAVITGVTIVGDTTTIDDQLIVYACGRSSDVAGGVFSGEADSNVTGLTERVDDGSATGNGGGIGVWTATKATAGTYGSLTCTALGVAAGQAHWTASIKPASSAVTGTIAVTQAADVGALSGTVLNPITGTIAATQANQTGALTGTETISGTVAATQADNAGAFVGTVGYLGTVSATQADQTGALAGTVTNPAMTGTIAGTQDPNTAALTGLVLNPITGTIAVTQQDDVGALVGTESILGVLGATQADQTATLVGTVANPVTGVLGAVQDPNTATFAGTVVSDGTWNSTQDDQTGSFTGTVANPVTGTIAVTQQDQTGSLTGTNTPPAITGTIGATQDDQTGSFTGIAAFGVVGVLGAIQDDQTGTFTGVALLAVTGTINANQDPNTATFTGSAIGGAVTGVIGAVQDPNVGGFVGTSTSPILPAPGTVTCIIGGPTVDCLIDSPTVVCVLTGPSVACTITQVSVAGTDTVITSTFKNAAGVLTDPAVVTATIQHPDGTQTSPTPTSSSVGIWTTVIPSDLDEGGWWFGQIQGTGNGVNAVCKFSFCLEASLVLV